MSRDIKILELDIETAPNKVYTWGLFKQNISINQIEEAGYTLCWAAKWLGKKEIIFKSRNDNDWLTSIWDLLNEADAVIHYNGSRFDIPTLNREFVEVGMTPPSPYHNIDLLKTIRRQFRFTSNKLDFVANCLGIGCKEQHKGFDLWTGCMNNNPKDWKVMKRYNIQDVKLLEKLYNKLLPWIANPPNRALYMDTTTPVCPSCGSTDLVSNGLRHTTTQSYRRYHCGGCGGWPRERLTSLPKEKRNHVLRGTA